MANFVFFRSLVEQLKARFIRFKTRGKFSVRWTIEVGTHATAEALILEMERNGFQFGDNARRILQKVPTSPVRRKLRLVVVSVAELGFTEVAKQREVNERAHVYGLEFCPREVVLQLPRQTPASSPDALVLNMMRAFEDEFYPKWAHDDQQVDYGHPEAPCGLDDLLIFVLP